MKAQFWRFGLLATACLMMPFQAFADDDNDGGNFIRESIEVSDHYMFQSGADPIRVPGATILVRDHKAGIATATIMSSALKPYDTYSIWWVVFNKPQNCAVPFECGSGDLRTESVKASVFWGGGIIADGDGYGSTQIEILRGRTKRELFGPLTDTGLRELRGAEIHLVLRTHGPAGIAGTVAQQIGTVNDACPAEGCKNVFFSRHRVAN